MTTSGSAEVPSASQTYGTVMGRQTAETGVMRLPVSTLRVSLARAFAGA